MLGDVRTLESGIRYRVLGTQGPVVVCVHGFTNSSLMWLPHIAPLLGTHRFILVDLPGHGLSKSIPIQNFAVLKAFADGLASLGKSEKVDEAYWVGFSLGAYTLMKFLPSSGLSPRALLAVDHPAYPTNAGSWSGVLNSEVLNVFKRLAQAVESEPSQRKMQLSDLPDSTRDLFIEMLQVVGEKSLHRQIARIANRLFFQISPVRNHLAHQVSWPWAFAIVEHYLKQPEDLRESIAQLNYPVHLVGPRKSSLFMGNYLERMAGLLKHPHLQYFENSGHDLVFNQPITFNRVLRTFLALDK